MDVLTRQMKDNCKFGVDENGRTVLLLRDGMLPRLTVCQLGVLMRDVEYVAAGKAVGEYERISSAG